MKIELFYFDGCPSYVQSKALLDQVLAEERVDLAVAMIRVVDDAEAVANRFPGSPTLRLDGQDLFPDQMSRTYGVYCRMYRTPDGNRGTPTKEMLRAALKRQLTQKQNEPP
jgi:hypothetical protein